MIFLNICIFGLLIFLSFVESNQPPSNKLNSTFLITGGSPKDEHDLGKFVASIRLRRYLKPSYGYSYQHLCGGTIISPKKILTAAHCVYNFDIGRTYQPFQLVVVVGSTNRLIKSKSTREMDVARVKRHRKFSGFFSLSFDVGFLILEDEIQFDNPQVGIMNLTSSKPELHKTCTIAGWGTLFYEGPAPDRLQFTDIAILENKDCQRPYKEEFTAGMICVAHNEKIERGSCHGDSGGPLFCDYVLVGITSFGNSCTGRENPSVYTDVYYFRDWISKGPRLDTNYFFIIFLTLIVKRV